MMPSIMSGSLIREMPPSARMSAGTRSRAMTATAPASSAILACSGVTTSMITPPLSCSAMPRLTRSVPVPAEGVPLGDSCAATDAASGSTDDRRLHGTAAQRRGFPAPSARARRPLETVVDVEVPGQRPATRAGAAAGAAAAAAAPGCRGRRRCRTAGPARRGWRCRRGRCGARPARRAARRGAPGAPARARSPTARGPRPPVRARPPRRRRGRRPAPPPRPPGSRGPAPRPARRGAAAGCPATSMPAPPGSRAAAAESSVQPIQRARSSSRTAAVSNQASGVTGGQASCWARRRKADQVPAPVDGASGKLVVLDGRDLAAAGRDDRLVDGQDAPGQHPPVVPGGHRRAPRAESSARRAGSASRSPSARASAAASPRRTSTPASPCSSTRANASRSLATIGAPAARASMRTTPKDSPAGWARSRRRPTAGTRALSSSDSSPRSATWASRSVADQLPRLRRIAPTGDEQPRSRVPADDGAHGLEQHGQALARLVVAAEEADRRARRRPGCGRAGWGPRRTRRRARRSG